MPSLFASGQRRESPPSEAVPCDSSGTRPSNAAVQAFPPQTTAAHFLKDSNKDTNEVSEEAEAAANPKSTGLSSETPAGQELDDDDDIEEYSRDDISEDADAAAAGSAGLSAKFQNLQNLPEGPKIVSNDINNDINNINDEANSEDLNSDGLEEIDAFVPVSDVFFDAEEQADHANKTESSEKAPDDGSLIAAYLAGDESALTQIIQRYHRPIYRMAFRWAKNSAEADDLTQRTFLRMLKHLKEFQGNQLKSYLFRITANLCKNHLRDTSRLVFGIQDEPFEEPDDSVQEMDEERILLRKMIERLPSRQRQVVLLRIDGELPFSEVAKVLGITENSAKVNFHHALRRLKQLRVQEESSKN